MSQRRRNSFSTRKLAWMLGAFALLFVGFKTADKYFEISRNMDIFGKVFTEVNSVYVDETNPTQMMQTGINGMLAEMDPYTNFFPESMIEQSIVLNSGQLSGIGAGLGNRGKEVIIMELFQEGVADKAGLRVGDKLLKIDDEIIGPAGRSLEEAQNLIQGESGSTVTLTYERDGQETVVTVVRGGNASQPENVPFSGMINEEVGYILLNNFMGSAGNEVSTALKNLKNDHPEMNSVVLDLRGNPGGRLDEAVNVCNVFLPNGTFITEMKGRTSTSNQKFRTILQPVDEEIPLVVLVDENSASASEIVSGAIQDLDRGVIVGRRSFGKGLVQNVRPLTYNTQMKITIARYYIPSGRCIQSIDYFHRNADGSAGQVPDSAVKAFETKNGRIVYDGGGILPDVIVEKDRELPVLTALKTQGYLFDYVTKFKSEHDSISSSRVFQVDNETYEDFVLFVRERGFEFNTGSESALISLEEALESEEMGNTTSSEVESLKEEIAKLKIRDLDRHQERIAEELRKMIVSRYYFKEGLLESGFSFDPDIRKAVEVLRDVPAYREILE